ncbi:hypothetical protein J3R82DRAFT_6041 [Butyriboletus roseoflavus]|nr:hypothetical protein J3R82DRAFT_6041 [Butyriboletus roseoflavus]
MDLSGNVNSRETSFVCPHRSSFTISWDGWSYNCTSLSVGFFLPGIPPGTVVPAWAFQNMAEVGYIFNVTLAQSVGDNPESTGTHVQSTSSLAATSTLASASLTNSASASAQTSSSSSPNTTVIAGAVGGVVGLALVVAIVILLRRKKPSQTLPTAPPAPDLPPDYTDSIPLFPQTERPKLYDPSDPSTFPSSVPPMTIMTESSNNDYDRTTNHSIPTHLGGHYTGMPEL